jgi:hypothetical protein
VSYRLFFLFILCAGLAVGAIPLNARTKHSAVPVLDREYVAALASANQFLSAWQNQDHEAGIILLTNEAKHQISEERLETFFAAGPSIRQSYEIGRGKKLNPGRYTFPVTLFTIGPDHKWVHPHVSQIVVVDTGRDDWAVDRLP